MSRIVLQELSKSLKKDGGSFHKTVEKPPESHLSSGSIYIKGDVTSLCDLDSEMKNLLTFYMFCIKIKGVQLRIHHSHRVLMEDLRDIYTLTQYLI